MKDDEVTNKIVEAIREFRRTGGTDTATLEKRILKIKADSLRKETKGKSCKRRSRS